MIYLYLKTHNKTGLKYLGKTIRDPFKYKGSGKYWLRHLAKHGDDVTTEILFSANDKKEITEKGLYYSTLLNVVESSDFANLRPESGDGGDTLTYHPNLNEIKHQAKERGKKAKWWNNGITQCFREIPPDSSYVHGRGQFNNVGAALGAAVNKERHWINDGTTEIMVSKNTVLPGYSVGRLLHKAFAGGDGRHSAKGTFWWNNGVIAVMAKEPPNDSFVKGRLPKD